MALWLLLLFPSSGVWGQVSDSNRVQVRLNHETNIQSARLDLENGTLDVHLPGGGVPPFQVKSGETTRLSVRGNEVVLRRGDDGLYGQSLHLAPASEARWSLALNDAPPDTYTGGLHVAPAENGDGLLLVNSVPLNDYVASVVASEYGFDDQEGAKAMAVVARTYALYSAKNYTGNYEHVDGTLSQVYAGVDAVTGTARFAARQTRGEILTYEGSPIQAVYFSSSGGHTASNEYVWKSDTPVPYLRGKEDPYDQNSPHHRWSATVDRAALVDALSDHQGATVEGFLIGDRSPEGRVSTLELLVSEGSSVEIDANTFRLVVNEALHEEPLRSTWFDARRVGPAYVFEGRGFGHGVGLSQWGAHAMAQQGMGYREILRFYYTGVRIERMDGVQLAPSLPPVAEEPVPDPPDSTSRRIGW